MNTKLKGLVILLLIGASLFPVYMFYKFLQKQLRPRESGVRFAIYMITVFTLVFLYTFLLVFLLKIIFPRA